MKSPPIRDSEEVHPPPSRRGRRDASARKSTRRSTKAGLSPATPDDSEILETIFDHAPVMISFADRRGHTRMVNREWERVLGWTFDEVVSQGIDYLAHAYPDPDERRMVRRFVAEASGRWLDLTTITKEGRRIQTSWAVVLLGTGTISIGQDVTARKRAEAESRRLLEEVRASREALQIASRNLVRAREVERRAIARELHDEIGQLLTAVSLGLANSERVDVVVGGQLVREAQVRLRGLISRVRNLAVDLRPAMLDELGLVAALRWHCESYSEQTNISVHLRSRVSDDERFLPEVETAAYRIMQESLTNVARHAGTSSATVRLHRDSRDLWIGIADRGRGFVVQPPSVSSSAGLGGMLERATLLGGSLTIASGPRAGTLVTARLPLRIQDRLCPQSG